jgi:hypothetical protein
MDSSEVKVTGSGWVLGATVFLTVVWLCAGLVFTIGPDTTDTCTGWVVLCLKPGDFGAFLQGIFAPVAFFWVAAAVFIQSQELREQRRELRLTREEFEQNRDLLAAQVSEARNQASLLAQQTALLKTTAAETQADSILQAHILLVATRLRQYHNAWSFYPAIPGTTEPNEMSGHTFVIAKAPSETGSDLAVVAAMTKAVRKELRLRQQELSTGEIVAKFPLDFMRIYAAVRDCNAAAKTLPPASRVVARAAEIEDLFSKMQYLLDRAENLPQREDS